MLGFAVTVAIVLSAAPHERHAALLRMHLDGSASMLKRMSSEFDALDAHWAKLARTGHARQRELALKKREELALHFADELENAPVPPEIVRLGAEGVATYQDAISERVARLRGSAPERY